MKLYDITLPIETGMTPWPGHPEVSVERFRSLDEGASSNLTRLAMSVHTGTHVDAPCHFLAGGGGVEQLSLEALIGPAWLAEFPVQTSVITREDLDRAGIPADTLRLLCKTRRHPPGSASKEPFDQDFTALLPDAAEWIIERGIRLVGIDSPSIGKYREPGYTTHHKLLRAGVVVLEGLDLGAVPVGSYQLLCLPLNIVGSDGAPARAILEEKAKAA